MSVIDIQRKHVSIRKFRPEPVENTLLEEILEAARRAPTSSNMQAYSIIIVRDIEKRQELSRIAGGQQHILDCGVFLVFCADLYRLGAACSLNDVEMEQSLETFLVASVDASLVGMSTQTAAESLGLGAVMVGALRNDVGAVHKLLGLPLGVYPVFGMSVGWPDEDAIPPQKPRLPYSSMVHEENYNLSGQDADIEQYDAELANHYEAQGRNAHPRAWSGPISRSLARRARSELLKDLQSIGFKLA